VQKNSGIDAAAYRHNDPVMRRDERMAPDEGTEAGGQIQRRSHHVL
jgi:hypothetical protein